MATEADRALTAGAPASTAALRLWPWRLWCTVWPWRWLGWCAQAQVAGGILIGLGAAVIAPPLNHSWSFATVQGWLYELLMIALFVAGCPPIAAWQRRAVGILGYPHVVADYGVPLGPAATPWQRISWWARNAAGRGFARDVAFGVAFLPAGALAICLVWGPVLIMVMFGAGVAALASSLPFSDLAPRIIVVTSPVALFLWPHAMGATAWLGAFVARSIMDPGGANTRSAIARVEASRRRLSDAFDAERKRIERDLHDGAQQRIVAQAMTLGSAEWELTKLGAEAEPALDLVRQATSENRAILAELRALVRAVHPQVLTDHGLAAAVAEVTARSSVPVEVDIDLLGRAPALVESTAYFVVLEAMANAAKHSGAQRVEVRGRATDRVLSVAVVDHGVGGAIMRPGGGLAGLKDRVEAVGGRLVLSSPRGGPTLVRADLPLRVDAPLGAEAPPDVDSPGVGSPGVGSPGETQVPARERT